MTKGEPPEIYSLGDPIQIWNDLAHEYEYRNMIIHSYIALSLDQPLQFIIAAASSIYNVSPEAVQEIVYEVKREYITRLEQSRYQFWCPERRFTSLTMIKRREIIRDELLKYWVRNVGWEISAARWQYPHEWLNWFLDCGAFTWTKDDGPFKGDVFLDIVYNKIPLDHQPIFIVVPDIVSHEPVGKESLKLSNEWIWTLPPIFPYYLVIHGGIEPGDLEYMPELRWYDGIFIGMGVDRRKKSIKKWSKFARTLRLDPQRRLRLHIGKASAERDLLFYDRIKVDSVDSTTPIQVGNHDKFRKFAFGRRQNLLIIEKEQDDKAKKVKVYCEECRRDVKVREMIVRPEFDDNRAIVRYGLYIDCPKCDKITLLSELSRDLGEFEFGELPDPPIEGLKLTVYYGHEWNAFGHRYPFHGCFS